MSIRRSRYRGLPRSYLLDLITLAFGLLAATGDSVGVWLGVGLDEGVLEAGLDGWVDELGLDPSDYGTHSMRRTKATLIYRRTKNLRAVQLLLGHSKLESTVRYLGIEVDDALEIAEQTEV